MRVQDGANLAVCGSAAAAIKVEALADPRNNVPKRPISAVLPSIRPADRPNDRAAQLLGIGAPPFSSEPDARLL